MAALEGFDTIYAADFDLSGAVALGDTLASVTVPPNTVVAGLDLTSDDLDTHATPLIMLTVGDAADTDRLLTANAVAKAGGEVESRPDSDEWYRYAVSTPVYVRVSTGPATSATTGTVSLQLYTYRGYDLSEAVKRTLQTLGILREGETPSGDDDALVRLTLRDVHEQMRGKGIANRQDLAWPVELIPSFAVWPYARMAALLLADAYAIPQPRWQRLAGLAVQAERDLRAQVRKASAGDPVEATFY